MGGAKNAAISLSSGRFLCFNDADDISAPNRISSMTSAIHDIDTDLNYIFLGSQFRRFPEDSTVRFTNWANKIPQNLLKTQIYTAFGSTLVAPTWFVCRKLWEKVGGFREDVVKGYPEDLDFFLKSLEWDPVMFRVSQK